MLVNADFWIIHVLAHVRIIGLGRTDNTFYHRHIEKIDTTEIGFSFLVKLAEFPHLFVKVDQFTVSAIE